MANRGSGNQGQVPEDIDWQMLMTSDQYELIVGNYRRYVAMQVGRIRKHYKGGTVLSVGCGNGDIESELPFDIVCYDIHDTAKKKHPHLDFKYEWPSEKFDLVVCLGAVLSYIHPSNQDAFVSKLIQSTTDLGKVIYSGIGYTGNGEPVYPTEYISHPKVKVL